MKHCLVYIFSVILVITTFGCDFTAENKENGNEMELTDSIKNIAKEDKSTNSVTVSNDPEKDGTEAPKSSKMEIGGMEVTNEFLMGKFDPKSHPGFVSVSKDYCSREGMLLLKETYEAYKKMHSAAKADGINLTIISDTRNFNRQKQIWEAKWTGTRLVGGKDLSKTIADSAQRALKILEFSSMPGTSRHHWGTDIDINNLENSYFESGKGKLVYDWLTEHAPGYGFCQPYTEKNELRQHGYEEEKWHWSFTPVSRKLTLAYKERITDDMISGFKGSESAKMIGVIEKYVLGIHPECLKYAD